MAGTQNLNLLLDLYQKSKAKGEWASLLLETKNGKDIITFKIESVSAGLSAETGSPVNNFKARKKTPSQFRRDEKRKKEFLTKKNLEPNESSKKVVSSDAVKALLVEPKDEINLEKPDEKEVEKEVSYVGEYVYGTKLDHDEIHQEIWKKLDVNFKDGVKNFFDGSTSNEKILIFWGKCSFKEGYDRSYILNKENWPKEVKSIQIEDPG